MTSAQDVTVTNLSTAERLSEALAEVFRTAEVGDVLTDDVFLDGNPPLWRFQLQGIDAFAAWYKSYAPNGMDEVTVVRTVPTASGFVTELTERNREDDGKERRRRQGDYRPRDHALHGPRRPDLRADRLLQRRLGRGTAGPPRGRSADAAPVTGHLRTE
jgi:hypothetical protein